jgi:hypothetical protein
VKSGRYADVLPLPQTKVSPHPKGVAGLLIATPKEPYAGRFSPQSDRWGTLDHGRERAGKTFPLRLALLGAFPPADPLEGGFAGCSRKGGGAQEIARGGRVQGRSRMPRLVTDGCARQAQIPILLLPRCSPGHFSGQGAINELKVSLSSDMAQLIEEYVAVRQAPDTPRTTWKNSTRSKGALKADPRRAAPHYHASACLASFSACPRRPSKATEARTALRWPGADPGVRADRPPAVRQPPGHSRA